uniref:Proteophosphoglycan ppg4 n=1 Tax=Moniliophthora roreri TaxID=221103 RepID=A0A0W0FMD2_MONRR
MSNNNEPASSETPRDSTPPVPSPTWGRPKAPLPPHRLAKLANALGVPTPVHHYPNYPLSPSTMLSPTLQPSSEPFRRSPSPSASSVMTFNTYAPPTSKFLLHVIPPLSIPHDSNDRRPSVLTPPPQSASGYHTQFRRGTLVPVYPTLQAQLWAIAREYALPSTTGIVLYLVSNPRSPSTTPTDEGELNEEDEPGPRLSEEVWKHLWIRVWKVEQQDESFARPASPGLIGLGLRSAARSTPTLLRDGSPNGTKPLRPLLSSSNSTNAESPLAPPYPSPSTPSSTSETPLTNKSPPESSSSHSLASGSETPDTSVPSDADSLRANSLDLPGLNSQSIIPILAKVEFDIDRKKAGWYKPWLRSRKMNHDKRRKAGSASVDDASEGKPPPIKLRLTGRARTASPTSMFDRTNGAEGYEPLDDDDDFDSDYDDDETARVASTGRDPLADVFGNDADTWADMRNNNQVKRKLKNPKVVDLALTGAELSADPDEEVSGGGEDSDDVAEVDELIRQVNPQLNRKNVPPPLVIHGVGSSGHELGIPSPQKSSGSASGSTHLPYLKGTPEAELRFEIEDLSDDGFVPRSGPDLEKRVGAVFEDLDLGLDPSLDYDARRRSQLLFKERLDEIERNLAQLSPRALKIDLEEMQNTRFSSSSDGLLDLPPGAPRSRDVLPASPINGSFDKDSTAAPRLAVNGVATPGSQPPFDATRFSQAEDDSPIPLSPDPFGRYPSSPPETAPRNSDRSSNNYWDPVPAGVPTENLRRKQGDGQDLAGSRSSRFSADSVKDEVEVVTKSKGVVSMKTIKRLWRRSNKSSGPSLSPPPPTPATLAPAGSSKFSAQQAASKSSLDLPMPSPISTTFGRQSPHPPVRPERPSQEELDIPDIPEQLAIPLQPASGRPAPIPIIAAQMLHGKKSGSEIDLHFDQESPYPTARRKASSRSVSPAFTDMPPPQIPPHATESQRTSIRKSILKWKSAAQNGGANGKDTPGRPGMDRVSSDGARQRRPSIGSTGSTRTSAMSPEIPPSPRVPEQFLNSQHLRSGSHLTSSSVDTKVDSLQSSPPRTKSSLTTRSSSPPGSSKDSDGTRPSFDESQFEIISPKNAGSLTYPYNTIDGQ